MNLKITLSALGLAVLPAAPAAALEKVTFQTNWFAQAEHGGYYQAQADGFYADCGLDVTIAQGGPQVAGRPLLVAGKVDFYMGGNLLQAVAAVEQGIPLRVVAAHFQKEPQVLMTHPGQGLDTWEDAKNADKFIISDPGMQSFFRWMESEYGFDSAKRVPYTFNSAPFLADKKSAQQGYVTSEPFAIEKEAGFVPNQFLLADYGFDTYATTIEAMQSTIDERPEVVQCFVDASAKGWYNFLYGDHSAASAAIKQANPNMTDELIEFSIGQMKKFGIVDSGEAEQYGIGAMTEERMHSFYGTMVEAKVLAEGIDITKAYTLRFVNKGVGLDLKK